MRPDMRNIVFGAVHLRQWREAEEMANVTSDDFFESRRVRRFSSEIHIVADMVRGLVLRSSFKTHAFAALHARREAFSRFHVAEMGDAVLVVVHPVHAVFGNARPRLKRLPEHIKVLF